MAGQSEGVIDGVFAVNKPAGISSAQVLRDLQHNYLDKSELFAPMLASAKRKRESEPRSKARVRRDKKPQHVKMGHGGTLDPMATGVLIIGVGEGTKSLPSFLGCRKTYETTIVFGAATDTYDITGKAVKNAPFAQITRESVTEALAKFRGTIMQRPPVYSAKWINGKRAYDIARAGGELPEMQEKEMNVEEMELVEWLEPGSHGYKIPEHATSDITTSADTRGDSSRQSVGSKRKTTELSEVEAKAKKAKVEAAKDPSGTDPSTSSRNDTKPDPTVDVEVKTDTAKESSATSTEVVDAAAPPSIDERKVAKKAAAKEPSASRPSTSTRDDTAPDPTITSPSTAAAETLTMSGALQPLPDKETTPPPSSPLKASETKDETPPAARIRMTVSSGFYVRSLCHDLGIAVGSAGFMASLVRSRQGQFALGKNVMEMEEFEKGEGGEGGWGAKLGGLLEDWNRHKEESVVEKDDVQGDGDTLV